MKYEFVDEGEANDLQQPPDFWLHAPDTIGKMLPFEAFLVRHESITYDEKLGWFGLGYNDRLHDRVPGDVAVPVMRVTYASGGQPHDGFLVDFRHKSWSHVYGDLPFNDRTPEMEGRNTQPVLGMVFCDDEGALYFRAWQDREELLPLALSMIAEVDERRRNNGQRVAGQAGKVAVQAEAEADKATEA